MRIKNKSIALLNGIGSIINIAPTINIPFSYYLEENPDLVALENDAIKVGLDFITIISKEVPLPSKRRRRRMRHVKFALNRKNHLIKRYSGIEIKNE